MRSPNRGEPSSWEFFLAGCSSERAVTPKANYMNWVTRWQFGWRKYSSLDQINASNVHRLEVAWSYDTGDANRYFFALVVGNVAYVLAKDYSIVAIDATNEEEIWLHKPRGKRAGDDQSRHQFLAKPGWTGTAFALCQRSSSPGFGHRTENRF